MRRVLGRLGDALRAPMPPENLAVFRIAVCAVSLLAVDVHAAPRFGGLGAALRMPPEELRALSAWIPAGSTGAALASGAYLLFLLACGLGLIGLFTRIATVAAALSGLYLLGVPQLYGTVTHTHHHVWFLAILAASPSGDALSVDAWARARRGVRPGPAAAYGIPVRVAFALIALIYFFPGYWKWRAGLDWALSDNLANQMHWKWLELGMAPPAFRLDRHPILCRAAALAVMIFEISMPLLVAFRRSRPIGAAAAIAFHLATDYFMGIRFTSLWLCYPVLFDWGWLRRARGSAGPLPRRIGPTIVIGSILVAGCAIQGARGVMQSWPFACYPTFARTAGTEVPDLRAEVEQSDGRWRRVDDRKAAARLGSQRLWGMKWAIAFEPSPERRAAALAEYGRMLVETGDAPDGRMRFSIEWKPAAPDD